MGPAIFLDRDGVIIENRDSYIRSWEDVVFLPGSLAALHQLARSPYKIVVVTNQSAIGRGLITRETADQINRQMVQVVEAQGGRIEAVYLCPHTPQENCLCRKPRPGLLQAAARDLEIDLSRSIMVGDALEDVQAGRAAGVARTILLMTGRGKVQAARGTATRLTPLEKFPNLLAAADAILNNPAPFNIHQ